MRQVPPCGLRALTICQPYAHLICTGDKRVENRNWETQYRGPLLIHAGKSRGWMDPSDAARYPDLVVGAIVAVADVVACLSIDRVREHHSVLYRTLPESLTWVRYHEHTHGPWCWVLGDVVVLDTPVPCRGFQRLWTPPADVLAAVMRQWTSALPVPIHARPYETREKPQERAMVGIDLGRIRVVGVEG